MRARRAAAVSLANEARGLQDQRGGSESPVGGSGSGLLGSGIRSRTREEPHRAVFADSRTDRKCVGGRAAIPRSSGASPRSALPHLRVGTARGPGAGYTHQQWDSPAQMMNFLKPRHETAAYLGTIEIDSKEKLIKGRGRPVGCAPEVKSPTALHLLNGLTLGGNNTETGR